MCTIRGKPCNTHYCSKFYCHNTQTTESTQGSSKFLVDNILSPPVSGVWGWGWEVELPWCHSELLTLYEWEWLPRAHVFEHVIPSGDAVWGGWRAVALREKVGHWGWLRGFRALHHSYCSLTLSALGLGFKMWALSIQFLLPPLPPATSCCLLPHPTIMGCNNLDL